MGVEGVGGPRFPDMSPGGPGPVTGGSGLGPQGPGPVVSGTGLGPPEGDLPKSIADATEWYLQGGTKHDTRIWGGDTYKFSMEPDNSGVPAGSPEGDTGFWVDINITGKNSNGSWSEDYKRQYYVVADPVISSDGKMEYTQYTVYEKPNGQRVPNLDTQFLKKIPADLGAFRRDDPVGYANFMKQFNKGIMKMTSMMFSQEMTAYKKAQKEAFGSPLG